MAKITIKTDYIEYTVELDRNGIDLIQRLEKMLDHVVAESIRIKEVHQ